MDKLTTFVFVIINIVNIIGADKPPNEDYCWRDFKGIIPNDALSVGYDDRGKPIYLGQVLVGNKLIPGKIHEDNDSIYYEWEEQAWSTNENVKIFCTKNPAHFEWLATTKYEVTGLGNTFLVKGGFQSEFNTYVGRATIDGKTDVGKVICRTNSCLALYVNDNGTDKEYHKFDILTYLPLTGKVDVTWT